MGPVVRKPERLCCQRYAVLPGGPTDQGGEGDDGPVIRRQYGMRIGAETRQRANKGAGQEQQPTDKHDARRRLARGVGWLAGWRTGQAGSVKFWRSAPESGGMVSDTERADRRQLGVWVADRQGGRDAVAVSLPGGQAGLIWIWMDMGHSGRAAVRLLPVGAQITF
jgi:hypothetical protein